MDMIELVQKYSNKLKNNPNDISYLLFALQIPSICSRIEFPKTDENTGRAEEGKLYRSSGKPWDANLYKAWLRKHYDAFEDIYYGAMTLNSFCDNLYALRNQVTHEGVLMTDKSKFYFTESKHAMSIGNIVFIPMKRLCENMLNVAYYILSNRHDSTKITLFSDMLMPTDIYNRIVDDNELLYNLFWDNRPEEDNELIIIYDHIISDNPCMKNTIEEFFAENPNSDFEIWDFGSKYGHIFCAEKFIHQKYDEQKSSICLDLKRPTDVLRLNKEQYEQMLQVAEEFEEFSNTHPFDITKYVEEERNLKEDRVRIDNIESEVTRFLQKYNSSDFDEECSELCLLPLCVMASKYNEIFPYRRKMYRDFCALTPDVQKAILVRTKLDYDIKQEPKFFDKCVDAISDAVKRYSQNDRDWFYDNGKYLTSAIEFCGKDKVPSYMCKADEEVERHNAHWNDNQTKMSFEDHIINLIKYSRKEKPIEQLLEEEIWKTNEDDKTKIISNIGKWTVHECDKAIAFLFCMIAMYLPLQFRKECLSTGREYMDDYPKDDLYMEDLFLKALHTIYVYLIHYDYYSRVDFF